ncbi:MAG: cytochrome c3 family protein, partial [Desulfobulbales bacterium]|nr:cytochrome c3 family protein [Desulfobulbales bacterium]
SLLDIPTTDRPATPLELADDLLRRRCLRCHVYYEGDDYSQVLHGTGCAACHLEYRDGKPVSHEFLALPTDDRCLSCHYANRVGGDYYGRFDHDFKLEYRTPYRPEGYYPDRPYAVEQHRLAPDIHQAAGMTCGDCHFDLHGGKTMQTIACATCHLGRDLPPAAKHLSIRDGELLVTTRQAGRELPVPRATNPVHAEYIDKAACAVCHAQWSYNDQGTHLLRIDHSEYEEWDDLYIQDSAEVEVLLLNSIYGDEIRDPVMSDKLNSREKPGLWLKGYNIRRWAEPPIDFARDGRLRVMRPILDLHISWIDAERKTLFDSITGETATLQPYTPHTIGKAGAFYHRRIAKLFPREPNLKDRKP